jgi:hypothetical protein
MDLFSINLLSLIIRFTLLSSLIHAWKVRIRNLMRSQEEVRGTKEFNIGWSWGTQGVARNEYMIL